MRVGHGEALLHVSGDHGFVTRHLFLVDGVLDGRAVLVRPVKIRKDPAPAVLLVNGLTSGPLAVRIQVDDNALWTDSVRIAAVVPDLHAGNGDLVRFGLLRRMRIGDVKSVDRRRVIRHRILGNGVFDDMTVLRRLRILAKAVGPAAVFIGAVRRHHLAVLIDIVCPQDDRDALRTDSVRVA